MKTKEMIKKLEQWIFLPGDPPPKGLTTKEAVAIIKTLQDYEELRRVKSGHIE